MRAGYWAGRGVARSPNGAAEAVCQWRMCLGMRRIAATWAPPGLTPHQRRELCETHRINRRQRVRNHRPTVAAILADPQPAGGRAERQPIAAVIDREGMAVDH